MFLNSILFPLPPFFITAISVLSVLIYAKGGYSEIMGKSARYSKFSNTINSEKSAANWGEGLPGRLGMVLIYTPAFLVLFIHKYSGGVRLIYVILGALAHFTTSATMTYSQHLLHGLIQELAIDLKDPGMILFWVGISGNFYHRYLLSKMRKEGEKQYTIPKGGLFDKVVCPHYLFEVIGFWGISLISQTLYAFSFALGTTFYLMGRSYATRMWYILKFDNFPKDVKALFPYIM